MKKLLLIMLALLCYSLQAHNGSFAFEGVQDTTRKLVNNSQVPDCLDWTMKYQRQEPPR